MHHDKEVTSHSGQEHRLVSNRHGFESGMAISLVLDKKDPLRL